MKKITFTHFLLVLCLLTLSSCGLIIKSVIRKDDENVPPDFGKQQTILLVLKQKNGYNKKVEKMLKKYYSGDYVFVSKEDLMIQPYQDTVKYRYILSDNITITRVATGSTYAVGPRAGQPTNEMVSTAGRSFRIIDRETEKVHDTGVESGTSWKKILKEYLKKLDAVRKKNAGL